MNGLKMLVMVFILSVATSLLAGPSVAAPRFGGEDDAIVIVVEKAETADQIQVQVSTQDNEDKKLFSSVAILVDKIKDKIRMHALKLSKLQVVEETEEQAPAQSQTEPVKEAEAQSEVSEDYGVR